MLPSGKDIVDVEAGKPGKKSECVILGFPQNVRRTQDSDINFFRETQQKFAQEQKFTGDKAYVGEPAIKTPKKKSKNQELTSQETSQNKELAAQRIFVEHTIRLLKIFRVVQERFRLNSEKYTQIIMTICGLVRLRIGSFIL